MVVVRTRGCFLSSVLGFRPRALCLDWFFLATGQLSFSPSVPPPHSAPGFASVLVVTGSRVSLSLLFVFVLGIFDSFEMGESGGLIRGLGSSN